MFIHFEFTPWEIQAGHDAIVAKAAEGGDRDLSYLPLAEASMALMEEGAENAVFSVLAQMVLDGTYAIMRQPSVEARLSREIQERKLTAMQAARTMGELGVKSMIFASIFTYTPVLREAIYGIDPMLAFKEDTIGKLGSAVFGDAGNVVGGAHRLLKRHELNEPIADVITRSTHLPNACGGIGMALTDQAFKRLGRPYVLPRFLQRLTPPNGKTEVIFTEEARLFLRSLAGDEGGCPAGKMRNVRRNGTYLTDAWADVVSILVPEDATTNWRNIR